LGVIILSCPAAAPRKQPISAQSQRRKGEILKSSMETGDAAARHQVPNSMQSPSPYLTCMSLNVGGGTGGHACAGDGGGGGRGDRGSVVGRGAGAGAAGPSVAMFQPLLRIREVLGPGDHLFQFSLRSRCTAFFAPTI
jgi:hypothetical protein